MAFVHPSRAGLIPTDTRRDDPLTPPRQNYRDNRDRDGHDSRPRRSSPSYNDFSGRQPPPPEGRNENPPWRNGNENNMYPQRDGGRPVDTNSYRPPPGGGGYRGGGGSSQGWLERYIMTRHMAMVAHFTLTAHILAVVSNAKAVPKASGPLLPKLLLAMSMYPFLSIQIRRRSNLPLPP